MPYVQTNKRTLPLPLRLTLWYAAIFTISSLIALTIIYFAITNIIHNRMDEELLQDFEEMSVYWEQDGLVGLSKEITNEATSEDSNSFFIRLVDLSGKTLLSSDLSNWTELESNTNLRAVNNNERPILVTREFTNQKSSTRIGYLNIGEHYTLQMGVSLIDDDELLMIFRNIFLITMPLMTLAATLLGWFMARKALQGVRKVTAAALQISKGDLSRRVTETGGSDEIDQLAFTFNLMLDRIQTLLNSMRDMNDNIAHDLRSPLARIRGAAETILMSNPSIEDFKSVAGDTIEECDRLLHMINTMLDITETEAGSINSFIEPIDVADLVEDACELMCPVAEDTDIILDCHYTKGAIVNGNVPQLQRLVGNLLENALKYTSPGGQVTLELRRENNDIIIDVKDNGIGISHDDINNIFSRFYRSDQSRSEPGSGLGLSLAIAIAHVHGGDITVSSELGKGSHFRVQLPAIVG